MGARWPSHTCRLLVTKAKCGHECFGVGEVWVRVPAPKVLLWIAVQQGALWGAQLLHNIYATAGTSMAVPSDRAIMLLVGCSSNSTTSDNVCACHKAQLWNPSHNVGCALP